jgi:hypothetical protein
MTIKGLAAIVDDKSNPLIGALTGALSGGLFCGAGDMIATLPGVVEARAITTPQALIEASLIHAAAGVTSGAIGAGIGGGNINLGALTGGISAGVAEGIGGALSDTDWFKNLAPVEKFFVGLGSRAGIGAVTGGVASEMVCGQFLHGFGQGAWTAAYGFLFNAVMHGALMTAGDAGGRPTFYDTVSPDGDPAAATIDNTSNALALAVTVGAGVYYAEPYVLTLGLSYAPQINQWGLAGIDFANGYLPGTPPASAFGYAGFIYGNFVAP